MSYYLQSGIPFLGGSEISFDGSFNIPANVTLSGYIPSQGVPIPALGDIGMGIMLLFLAAVGGFVFSRSRGMGDTASA